MSSNIIPGNIDGAFPVAGQDNSSQGFRDNFTAIKNNFTEARTEIIDLQDNKASTDSNTSFNDYVVTRATLKDCAELVFAHGSVSDTIILNHESGHYQTATTSGAISIAFNNWPGSAKLGRIVLDITFSNTAHTLTVTSATLVADNVSGFDSGTNIITAASTGRYLYEFVTPDGGTTVLMHQIGKLYS
jgi:hypothetical protein